MDDLIAHGHVRRAILGALIADVTQEDASAAKLPQIAGVKIEDFSPADNSPAKRAGMQPGDILVSVDGKPVDRVSTLQRIIRMHQPGDEVTFDDVRYGKHLTMHVKLAEAPGETNVALTSNDDDAGASAGTDGAVVSKALGVTLAPLGSHRKRGAARTTLRPRRARPGSAARRSRGRAARAGRHHHRRDPSIPRVATPSVADLQQVLGKLKNGDYVGLEISRQADSQGDRQTAVVNLRLGS